MLVRLHHRVKRRGGRLATIDTYVTQCNNKAAETATWNISSTLQSIEDSNDIDAFVGTTTELGHKPFVVKVMRKNGYSSNEKHIQKHFMLHPHRHIVQSICWFTCKDNPIRWSKKVNNQKLCVGGSDVVLVLAQDYIPDGDLYGLDITTIALWRSIFLQLTYGYIELFFKHGLLYNDWHTGNVLIDKEPSPTLSYNIFDRVIEIQVVDGICPVLTDFARSNMHPIKTLELWQLSSQISIIWEMMSYKCPNINVKKTITSYVYQIGDLESYDEIEKLVLKCSKYLQTI